MEERKNVDYRIELDMPVVVFVVIQIVFIVFVALSLARLLRSDKISYDDTKEIPVAKIDNLDSVTHGDYFGSTRSLEMTLFELAVRNSAGNNISTSVEAFIREDSIREVYFENKDVNYFSAIIDIPELEQSYWFYNEYSNDKNNEYIDYSKTYRLFCLDDSQEKIYPDFGCEDGFGLKGRPEIVSDLITYFEFNYFSASYSMSDNSTMIKIYPHSLNIDEETKQSYIQQTRDAVYSLGISPDLFAYRVMGPGDIDFHYPPRG